ncbi:MAG: 4'-phosphopantetheinyl transferase superfamily protein [Ruminococcaceae bacterium]|nr:4'-phosphopantetheinyl transferase superfamily protein [Oscillospiraceae bacterium]
MVELYGIRLSELPPVEKTASRCAFFDAWHAQHPRCVAESSTLASLGGLLLLEAAGYTGKLAYTALGRPYLCDLPIDFNYTHTATHVFLAIDRADADGVSPRIGIDAEDTGRESRIEPERMVMRWFTEGERQAYEEEGGTLEAFLRIWTKKEAFAKWQGDGLRVLQKSDTCTATAQYGIRFWDYREENSVISVCARRELAMPKQIRMLARHELLERLSEKKTRRNENPDD